VRPGRRGFLRRRGGDNTGPLAMHGSGSMQSTAGNGQKRMATVSSPIANFAAAGGEAIQIDWQEAEAGLH
jgi:hypothetical protein